MSRILIIDNHDLMRGSIADTLRREGHTIEAVASGRDALFCLYRQGADMVICSDSTPDLSSFLKMVRESDLYQPHKNIPIIGVGIFFPGQIDYLTRVVQDPSEKPKVPVFPPHHYYA